MKGIFISFDSKADRLRQEQLGRRIKKTQFRPVVATKYRKPMEALAKKIKEGIERSDVFIPILTKSSLGNQWVNQEIGYAVAKKKPEEILPIVEESVIRELSGFIHGQLDLPYHYSARDKKKVARNFLVACDKLLRDLEGGDQEGIVIKGEAATTKKSFRIVKPAESEVKTEWVHVSGIGAPAGWGILLFTWLKDRRLFSLQDDIIRSDVNGEWHKQKCWLKNINSKRELYAIAVPPEVIDEAERLVKKIGIRINPEQLHAKLEENGIQNILSEGKELIRREG